MCAGKPITEGGEDAPASSAAGFMAMAPVTPHIRYRSVYGGHPILRKKAADACEAVADFLRDCTDWDGAWPDNRVRACPADQFITRSAETDAAIEQIRRRLGSSEPGVTFSSIDTGTATTAEDWPVPPDLHDWAVERVLAAPAAKRGWPDALSCTCDLTYRLREPPKGRILPGQASDSAQCLAIRSRLSLSISSGNTSAIFDLVLPFEAADRAFIDYITAIRPYLPIRLAKGNFRQWLPNKKGTDYIQRRIDADLFAHL